MLERAQESDFSPVLKNAMYVEPLVEGPALPQDEGSRTAWLLLPIDLPQVRR